MKPGLLMSGVLQQPAGICSNMPQRLIHGHSCSALDAQRSNLAPFRFGQGAMRVVGVELAQVMSWRSNMPSGLGQL